MICSNCGTELGCECEKRTATNGTSCCRLCIDKYQYSLNGAKPSAPANTQSGTPIFNSIQYNPPKL